MNHAVRMATPPGSPFHAGEQALQARAGMRERIERAGESQRWPSFYQSWTYKEALAKALGEGVFGLPFDRILVSPDGRLEAADERLQSAPPDARLRDPDWRLAALRLGEGFAGAVAWRA